MSYRRAENNPSWKGEDAGYSAIHAWMIRNYGNPHKCQVCNLKGKRVGRRWNIEWANRTGKFLREKSDWIALCKRCHYAQDRESYRKDGAYISAKLTPDDVQEIRGKYVRGVYSLYKVAKEYGI